MAAPQPAHGNQHMNLLPSFPRRRESRTANLSLPVLPSGFWIPAFSGTTELVAAEF